MCCQQHTRCTSHNSIHITYKRLLWHLCVPDAETNMRRTWLVLSSCWPLNKQAAWILGSSLIVMTACAPGFTAVQTGSWFQRIQMATVEHLHPCPPWPRHVSVAEGLWVAVSLLPNSCPTTLHLSHGLPPEKSACSTGSSKHMIKWKLLTSRQLNQ